MEHETRKKNNHLAYWLYLKLKEWTKSLPRSEHPEKMRKPSDFFSDTETELIIIKDNIVFIQPGSIIESKNQKDLGFKRRNFVESDLVDKWSKVGVSFWTLNAEKCFLKAFVYSLSVPTLNLVQNVLRFACVRAKAAWSWFVTENISGIWEWNWEKSKINRQSTYNITMWRCIAMIA